jgi:hypothetical protein
MLETQSLKVKARGGGAAVIKRRGRARRGEEVVLGLVLLT